MLFSLYFFSACFVFTTYCSETAIGTICYKQILEAHPQYATYNEDFGGFLKPGLDIDAKTEQRIKQKLLLLESNYFNELKNLRLEKSQAISPILNSRKYSAEPEQAFLDGAAELNRLELDYRLKAIELKSEFESRRARLMQPILINDEAAQKLINSIKNDIKQAIKQLSNQQNIDLIQNECPAENSQNSIFQPSIVNGLVLPNGFWETMNNRRESHTRRDKTIKSYLQEIVKFNNSLISTPPFFPDITVNISDAVITKLNQK